MRTILYPLATLAMAMCALTAQAQIDCRGTVEDEQGEPVIGATVLVPGTQLGTSTDIDGRFFIKVPKGSSEIKLSAIGYKEVTLKAESNLDVVLATESKMLEDVVVTQSRAKTRVTPVAIAQVDAAQIEVKLGNQEFPEVLKTTLAYGPPKTVAASATLRSICEASRAPMWPCSSTVFPSTIWNGAVCTGQTGPD